MKIFYSPELVIYANHGPNKEVELVGQRQMRDRTDQWVDRQTDDR